MAYEVEETGELSRVATVTVPATEYKKRFNEALRSVGKGVSMRGFRKGKVPLGMLRKRYGASVQQDLLEDLVRSNINEVLEGEEGSVIHIGEPDVLAAPGNGEDLRFTVVYEVQPQIDPIGYLGLALDVAPIEISSDEVDERLEQMRKEFATLEPIALREEIAHGDIVTLDIKPVDEDDESLAIFAQENAQLAVGQEGQVEAFTQGLLGAGFHDSVTIEFTPDDNFPVDELHGRTVELQLDIKSVKQEVLPELDDDFAADTGDAKTLLELRSQVRDQLTKEKEHHQFHEAEEALVDTLLDQHEIALPEAFVEAQLAQEERRRHQILEQFNQQGLDINEIGLDLDEFTSGARDDVERQIRSEFLLLAIAREEELTLEEDDLRAYIEHQAQHSRVSPQQMLQHMQSSEEQWRQSNLMALLEKTKRFLLDQAEFVGTPDDADQDEAEADEADEA